MDPCLDPVLVDLCFGVAQQQLDDLVAGAARQRFQPDDVVGLGENPGLALKRQFIPAEQHGASEILKHLLVVWPRRLGAIAWRIRWAVVIRDHHSLSVIRIRASPVTRGSLSAVHKQRSRWTAPAFRPSEVSSYGGSSLNSRFVRNGRRLEASLSGWPNEARTHELQAFSELQAISSTSRTPPSGGSAATLAFWAIG